VSQSRESELQMNCPVCVPMPSDYHEGTSPPEGVGKLPPMVQPCDAHELEFYRGLTSMRVPRRPEQSNVEREWSPYPYPGPCTCNPAGLEAGWVTAGCPQHDDSICTNPVHTC
jgi:hypothetical protein